MDHDVVIVGAGIAGLALTRELHRRNVHAVTLERQPQLVDGGVAINLPGNAIAALRKLGLGDDLMRLGAPNSRREYRSSSGRLLFEIDEIDFWGRDNTPRCMRRSDLAAMLMKGVPESAIRRKCIAASVTSTEDMVEVVTSAGDRLVGSYLIGADGVHSLVRRMCFPESRTSIAGLGQASFRFIAANPGVDCWTVWMGDNAVVLLIPVGPGEVYGWATIVTGSASRRDPTTLIKLTADFPQQPRQVLNEALSDPKSLHISPLDEIRLSNWSNGRAILIGDAAHATAPVWAQGAALALEDSAVLAGLLSGGADPQRIGREYTRLREQRVRHVQAMTDRASKVSRLPGAVRNALLPFLGPLSYKRTYGPLR